jgi:hypothetical protein
MCVRAKEELSIEPDIRLSVPLPSGPREVTITRLELNDMIRPSVQMTTDALRRTIGSAGLRPDDLSAVLLAGGSSRIPLVSQLVSKEFGKPVRVTLHPKFTVALGAAAVAGRPHLPVGAPHPTSFPPTAPITPVPAAATPLPPAPRKQRAPQARRKWLVTTIAAAAVVVVGAVTTLLLTSGGGQAQESGTGAENLPTLRVFDGGVVKPWIGFVSSEENWGGTEFDADGASQAPITAKREEGGLRVTWSSTAGQVYLQTANPRDLKSYVDNDGALVFDVSVHTPPTKTTTVAVHCQYPCGAEVTATTLFQNLERDQKTTVKIPLTCFTAAGLDPKKVNTAFLVYTQQPFDATFSDVRWEPGAAKDSDATPCAKLR